MADSDSAPPIKLSARRRVWRATACLRNELPTRRPSLGENGVWIGGIPSRKRWRKLEARGVRTVIALTTEVPPPVWVQTGPDVHWLPVPDYHSPTVAQFREACTVLDAAVSAKRAAFIYCGAGKGRAPTVYAAWLIWRGAAVAEALARLRKVRRVAKPTAEQLAALAEWSSLQRRKE